MIRLTHIAAASAVGMLGACATASAPQAQTQTQTEQTAHTDEQLRAYAAARAEIAPIAESFAALTAEQRAQATAQIAEIQARHGLTPAAYDAITRAVDADPLLAARVAGLEGFTEAQVQAFASASLQIDPINRSLATATPEERSAAAQQIRDILARNNLDGATYNAIATRAQADQALAARIAAAQAAQLTPSEGE